MTTPDTGGETVFLPFTSAEGMSGRPAVDLLRLNPCEISPLTKGMWHNVGHLRGSFSPDQWDIHSIGFQARRSALALDAPAAFFSYSRDDSDFALRLAEDLKAAGANVWLDQVDIDPGQRWDRAVEDALSNCPRLLVILSPAAVNSTNVLDEVSFALETQKTVIPVLFRDCSIPFRLRRVQHVDFRTDYSKGLKALLKTLGGEQHPHTVSTGAVSAETQENHPDVSAEEAQIGAEQQAKQDEERRQAAERATVELEEREREIAAANALMERQEREQLAAADKARLEQERKQKAEQAGLDEEHKKREEAEATRLPAERDENRKQIDRPSGSVPELASGPDLFSGIPAWAKIAAPVLLILIVGLVLYSSSSRTRSSDGSLPTPKTPVSTDPSNPLTNATITPHTGWVVGEQGTILHTEDGGRTWQQQNSGTTVPLESVSFITPQVGWVVGLSGTILHTEDGGRTWQTQDSGTRAELMSVTFLTPQSGWAVGRYTFLRTEDGGRTWQFQSSGNYLMSVTFVASKGHPLGWAVAWDEGLYRTEDGGRTWHWQKNPPGMRSIAFLSPQEGWQAGGSGILRSDDGGSSWQPPVGRVEAEKITFFTLDLGWAVGVLGSISHTEDGGRNWLEQSSGTREWLHSVSFATPQAGWVVGEKGNILHTEDGGHSWQKQSSGVTADLYGVAFIRSAQPAEQPIRKKRR